MVFSKKACTMKSSMKKDMNSMQKHLKFWLLPLLAILLIITGVSGAISSFDTSDAGIAGRIIALVIAIAMIAAGVIKLFNLNEAADWLMIVIGVIMIVSGILNILGGVLEYRNLKA